MKPAFTHSHFHQWMNTSLSSSPPHIDVKKAARHRSDAVDCSEESNKRLKREGEQPKRDDDDHHHHHLDDDYSRPVYPTAKRSAIHPFPSANLDTARSSSMNECSSLGVMWTNGHRLWNPLFAPPAHMTSFSMSRGDGDRVDDIINSTDGSGSYHSFPVLHLNSMQHRHEQAVENGDKSDNGGLNESEPTSEHDHRKQGKEEDDEEEEEEEEDEDESHGDD